MKILHNSEEKTGQINIVGDIKPVESEKGSSNSFWILDTGATYHDIFLKNMFINFCKIKPLKIGLPNGTNEHGNYAGTIRLIKQLII